MQKVIKLNLTDDTFYKAYLTIITVGLGLSDEESSTLIDVAKAQASGVEVETVSPFTKRKLNHLLGKLRERKLLTEDNKLHAALNVERRDTTISFELRLV